jgi:hypothetical protein
MGVNYGTEGKESWVFRKQGMEAIRDVTPS